MCAIKVLGFVGFIIRFKAGKKVPPI